jgi:phosphoribosylformimino-5-aminoimidazole carboxamide ribotide isomerase
VLVGTAALDDTFLAAAVQRFGQAIVVAVDARDGLVTVSGWLENSELRAVELAQRCASAGVERLLVTSTSRDGTLAGPDIELLEEVLAVGLPVVAAGGIATLDDLRALRRLGCEGAVTGSAVWLGRFSVAEALSLEA